MICDFGGSLFSARGRKHEEDQGFALQLESNVSCAFCFTRVQMCASEVCKDGNGVDECMNE